MKQSSIDRHSVLRGMMALGGARYQPNVAFVTVGNGPFTMGPEEAARACQWLGIQHAIPVHYAHNPLVRGVFYSLG